MDHRLVIQARIALLCGALAVWGVAAPFAFASATPETESRAATHSRSPIRVGCFDITGSGDCASARKMGRCLASSAEFTVAAITAEDIRRGGLAKIDVLICPGGSGSKQAKALGADGRDAIRAFVRNGGGYVGFCAGSYLASSNYDWSLGILNAKVVDSAHWARGTGDVILKITPEGNRILGTSAGTVTCYYGQGPLLAPAHHGKTPDCQVLATYSSELTKHGAPGGVMIGTTAIAMGSYGKGRVLCFSPHPERTKGLEGFVPHAVRWAADKAN
jgi:glutamine amidotransferase-like uncharacterized protein